MPEKTEKGGLEPSFFDAKDIVQNAQLGPLGAISRKSMYLEKYNALFPVVSRTTS